MTIPRASSFTAATAARSFMAPASLPSADSRACFSASSWAAVLSSSFPWALFAARSSFVAALLSWRSCFNFSRVEASATWVFFTWTSRTTTPALTASAIFWRSSSVRALTSASSSLRCAM